jgi:hypothetical protein
VYSFTTSPNIRLERKAGKAKVELQVKFDPEFRHHAMKKYGEMKV